MCYKKINKSFLQNLPKDFGVYQFLDVNKKIIYIGKAKNLFSRVNSYFTKNHEILKTRLLVSKIADIKYILVDSELDALLLENNLIKKHKPRYNILLKDDKTYPWICINKDPLPKVYQTRRLVKDGSEYYGPFRSSHIIRILLDFFTDIFFDEGFTPFKYKNINLNSSVKKKYFIAINKIRNILQGNIREMISKLEAQMLDLAERMEFEKAQKIKLNLSLLENYQSRSTITNSKTANIDVFSILSEKNTSYINYLKIVQGSVVLSHNVEIKNRLDESDEKILQFVIPDLRSRFNSPSNIILCNKPVSILHEKLKVIVPKIGEKKKIIQLSLRNTKYIRHANAKKIHEAQMKKEQKNVLSRLKNDLHLKSKPKHIECFDISNLQGTNSVASCVVFINGKPKKSEYRYFNIKNISGPNDFLSIYQVVKRRYMRLLKEKKRLPDLIIIDGGKGQLSSALKSLNELKLRRRISIIGIAKRLEEIFFPNDTVPLYLDKRSSSLKLIQNIRNEAHRFSIKNHRKKRLKKGLVSSIEKINGLGPITIDRLISHFKTIKNIYDADFFELEKIIGKSKAKKIIQFKERQ